MATINNIKGTSYPSFAIGKRGITVYQDTVAPDNGSGSDGDIFVQRGVGSANQGFYQKIAGVWSKLQPSDGSLDQLTNITPSANYTLGTNSSGYELRSPAQQIAALNLGTSATVNIGTGSGQIPTLDVNGKLPASTMPPIAITNVYTVADDAARDALTVETGDVAIVTSTGIAYIYDGTAWQVLGSAGTVSAIQGPGGTSKSGIVSLDATDILSGVFTVAQGGTGISSYAAGDLLVGNGSNTLNRLTMGAEGSVLSVKSGTPTWYALTATDIKFTANTANHLVSTNVGDAILEAAAERPFINTTTSDPTVTNDSDSNFKIGDIWVNTTSDKFFVAVDVTVGAAVWKEGDPTIMPSNVRFVATNGSDTNSGGLDAPWSTIAHALGTVSSGATVVIFPGTYSDTLVVAHDNVMIKAVGSVVVTGKLGLTGANFTSVDVDYLSSTNEAVEINAATNSTFKGGSIKHTNPSSTALKLTSIGTGNALQSVQLGVVQNLSSTSNALKIQGGSIDQINNQSGLLNVLNVDNISVVEHAAGTLRISGARTIGALDSVAAASSGASLIVENASFLLDSGSYGSLTKTGDCPYTLNDVDWDNLSTLTGTRSFGRRAQDISADFTPTNYTAAAIDVKSHLQGIDTKLAAIAGGAVSSFNELSDVAAYTADDANKVVKVNSDGTGLEYGLILDTAATQPIAAFATAAQGSKADSAVQPGDLSAVATGGKFTDLTDAPSSYGLGDAKKVLQINAAGTAIELGNPLKPVAVSGLYSDLTGTPTLGTAAALDTGTSSGDVPVLDGSGKLDVSVIPAVAITDVYVVATIADRDALTVQGGDVAKVTEDGQTYIYDGTQWIVITAQDQVQSVNSQTGVVVLDGTDIDSTYTPTNYTIANAEIDSHLAGIDTKLANVSTDKIITGTTSVQTNEVANEVTVNANGTRVATFDDTGVQLSGTGDTQLTSGAGEAIDIRPGDSSTGDAASMSISGGSTTFAGGAGGHLVLNPGTAGAGGTAAQVLLQADYVPVLDDSVVNKSYVDGRTGSVTIVTASGDYTALASDAYVLLKKTTGAATQVTLPSSPATGKVVTIKDAKGDAQTNNITVVPAAGTIDGASSQVINYNYEALTLIYNGTEWNII